MSTQTLSNGPAGSRHPFDTAILRVGEFLADVEAHTIPRTGGRRFVAFASVEVLSESFDCAASAVIAAERWLFALCALPSADGRAFGAPFDEAEVFRANEIDTTRYSKGLRAALEMLGAALSWPCARHNEESARWVEGQKHGWKVEERRFHFDDVLEDELLCTIQAGLLALKRAPLPSVPACRFPRPAKQPHSGLRLVAEALAWLAAEHPEARTMRELYRRLRECPAYDGRRLPALGTFERYVREVRRMSSGGSAPEEAA